MKILFSTIVIVLFFYLNGYSQNNITAKDTIISEVPDTIKLHSPKKAMLLSLVPGIGQIYNKKYWKAPIIWGGIAASIYFALDNRDSLRLYKNAYILRSDTIPTNDNILTQISTEALNVEQTKYRKNMELLFVISGALYALNLVDALVDAHLFTFDVSNNLSLKVEPFYQPSFDKQFAKTGVNINFKF